MRNAGLDELHAGIKIGGRNINSLRYADDTTLMADREEELKSFLMRVKEEGERAEGERLNIRKKLRLWHPASICITNRRGKGGSSERFPPLGSKITADK